MIDAADNNFDIDNLNRVFWEFVTAPKYAYMLYDDDSFAWNIDSTSNNATLALVQDTGGEPRFTVQLSDNVNSDYLLIDSYTDTTNGTYTSLENGLSTKKWGLLLGNRYDDLVNNKLRIYEGISPTPTLWSHTFEYMTISFGNTSADAIRLYNKYVLPNATPASDGDAKVIKWTNGTPTFDTLNLPQADGTASVSYERLATPINGTAHGVNVKYVMLTGSVTGATLSSLSVLPADMAVDGSGMPVYWNMKGMCYDTTALTQWPVGNSGESGVAFYVDDDTGPKFVIDNTRVNTITYAVMFEYVKEV